MAESEDDGIRSAAHPASTLPFGGEGVSILVLSGPGIGHCHKAPRDGGVIGSDPGAEVSIADPGISQHHARLERRKGAWFVIHDLGSRYGIFVDGKRTESHVLSDGDRIQLSDDTVIRVRCQEAKETEALERRQDAMLRDPLTGVANRRYLLERLEQELGFSRRHGAPFALLLLDIDFFSRINGEHGHVVGDRALLAVARALQSAVRIEDVLARYGGDQFTVLSRGYDQGESQRFGERLVSAIRDKTIRSGEKAIHLTLSAGIAAYHRGEPESVMQLIARADAALYRAKHRGRNQVAVWNLS